MNYINVNASPFVPHSLVEDNYLSVDSSVGAIFIALPEDAPMGQSWTIKDRSGDASSNNITVSTNSGSVDIDGLTSFVMNTAYQSIRLIGNGNSYEVF